MAGIPKLMISATGDEFFLVTDSHTWWDEMQGDKWIMYVLLFVVFVKCQKMFFFSAVIFCCKAVTRLCEFALTGLEFLTALKIYYRHLISNNLWVMARESWVIGRGPWIMGHGSWVVQVMPLDIVVAQLSLFLVVGWFPTQNILSFRGI